MTGFIKYQHVERYGKVEVDGIEQGTCYVFPKIDGTNGQVWLDEDGTVRCGSRNRELTLDNDNAGFLKATLESNKIVAFIHDHPDLRLYGEWLVPHSFKLYREDAWRKFYVFDVCRVDPVGEKEYLTYDEYSPLLEDYGIEYIPPIFYGDNLHPDRFYDALEEGYYLVEDGKGTGEGIVIKNYDYRNRFGKTVWAKIVTSEFKAKHCKSMGAREITEKPLVEDAIALQYVTKALVDKVVANIEIANDCDFTGKDIPRLLGMVYYDLVNEEAWDFVKKHKNPTINFKLLNRAVILRIKEHRPELF